MVKLLVEEIVLFSPGISLLIFTPVALWSTLHVYLLLFQSDVEIVRRLAERYFPFLLSMSGGFLIPVVMEPEFQVTSTGAGRYPVDMHPMVTSDEEEKLSQQGNMGKTDGALGWAVDY